MKPTRTALLIATVTLVSLALPVGSAQADQLYECSGIGVEGREAARNVPHSLRLVFARPDGEYLGNVEARVSKPNGGELVAARCPGPWVLLDLPDGTYEVLAGFKGETQTRTVTVRAGQVQEHTFVF